jgi:hypothetical protein
MNRSLIKTNTDSKPFRPQKNKDQRRVLESRVRDNRCKTEKAVDPMSHAAFMTFKEPTLASVSPR